MHWAFTAVWFKKHGAIMKIFKAEILCAGGHHKIFVKTDAENKAYLQVRDDD